MANVLPQDMLSPVFLDGLIQRRNNREHMDAVTRQYIGDEFFPVKDYPEHKLMWETLKDETVNDLAGVYALKDRAVTKSEERSWETHFAEMVVFKAARTLDQDIVTKVRDPGMPALYSASGDTPFLIREWARRVQEHVTRRIVWCDNSINATREYLALSAMRGVLTWPPRNANGTPIVNPPAYWNADASMKITFPYHAPFRQKATTLYGTPNTSGVAETSDGLKWSNAAANIIEQLDLIAEFMIHEKNVDANDAEIIMSRTLLRKLQYNTLILKWLVGDNWEQSGARNFIPPKAVSDFIVSRLGYTIRTYDAKWTYPNPTETDPAATSTVRFLPDNLVIIKPRGSKVGVMAQGPHETPEGTWKTGKISYVYRDPRPPHEREMGITWIGFPIMQYPDEHFILDALN